MIGIPHPSVVIAMAEEHRAELLAQAERHALATSAQAARRPRRGRLPVVAVLAALLLALGMAAAQEPPRVGQATTQEPRASQASNKPLLGSGAARPDAAARL